MGTLFRITLYPADETSANRAVQAAFRRIEDLDQRLSDYREDSELNQLCRRWPSGTAVTVSKDLWQVLRDAQQVADRTNGAFDVTIGPMSRIWRRARRQRQMPSPEVIAQTLQQVGFRRLSVDPVAPRVTLLAPSMQLDLGGIAKGFAAEEALKVLEMRGEPSALVDGGGGVAVGSPPPGKTGWRIGVPEPLQSLVGGSTLALSRCSVTTSGDTQQFLDWQGKRYSHILDPRTGVGSVSRRMALVVAPQGALADSLATALCVADTPEIPRILSRFAEVQAAVTEVDSAWGGYCTNGMGALVATEADARTGPNATGTDTN